jgi:hypothetical protein
VNTPVDTLTDSTLLMKVSGNHSWSYCGQSFDWWWI